MPLLAVPNWSLGRERSVIREACDLLASAPVTVHFCQADIDHNRTVTAFSGTPANVQHTLLALADLLLPCINLQRHTGVHPRIGGLDVCPFVPIPHLDPRLAPSSDESTELNAYIKQTAHLLAEAHNIPIFLYEHSAPGNTLPNLRKGGFGGLLNQSLNPDFGPSEAHPHLGASVLGWRNFLIALNINFPDQPGAADSMRQIATLVRDKRRSGDPAFTGVRALGLELQAQELAQLSLNITDPQNSEIDTVISFIEEQAERAGLDTGYTQLIGVIRDIDIERTLKIYPAPEQIVHTRLATDWNSDWPQTT